MMLDPFWQAVILGILQGLTEFLPISSSAHLILIPWFLGWPPMGIAFDVVIHGGTLIAVLLYFRQDWQRLTYSLLNRFSNRVSPQDKNLVDAIVVGTLPAILAALLFRSMIEEYARQPLVTVFSLSIFGGLLLWADRRGLRDRELSSLAVRDGLWIGIAQSLALIPGVSRSGATITMALLLGFSRPECARFSFLLAGPIIALGTVKGFQELVTSGDGDVVMPSVLVAGIAVSFVVGFLCIKYFLQFLRSRTYLPFVGYRFLLAAAILIASFVFGD